jgi:putative membrane protein insertion efficiency factor
VPSPAALAIASDPPKPGIFARLLILFVRLYQLTLGHFLGGHCRFQPSCSNYALEVLRTHGAWRGALRSAARVSRCHPFHPGGYDPPPPPPSRSARDR